MKRFLIHEFEFLDKENKKVEGYFYNSLHEYMDEDINTLTFIANEGKHDKKNEKLFPDMFEMINHKGTGIIGKHLEYRKISNYPEKITKYKYYVMFKENGRDIHLENKDKEKIDFFTKFLLDNFLKK